YFCGLRSPNEAQPFFVRWTSGGLRLSACRQLPLADKLRDVDFLGAQVGRLACGAHAGKLFFGEFDPVSGRRPGYVAVKKTDASPRFGPWNLREEEPKDEVNVVYKGKSKKKKSKND